MHKYCTCSTHLENWTTAQAKGKEAAETQTFCTQEKACKVQTEAERNYAHLCIHTYRVALQEEVDLLQRQAADAQALMREVEYWRKRAAESAPSKAEVGRIFIACVHMQSIKGMYA